MDGRCKGLGGGKSLNSLGVEKTDSAVSLDRVYRGG